MWYAGSQQHHPDSTPGSPRSEPNWRIAGLVLAGSEFSHQAHAEVRPLRDLLTSLFFVSLGMLIDGPSLVRSLPLVVAISVAAVLVKALAAGAALAASGTPLRIAAIAAVCLA